ncbi:unnamed protein product [Paramecium sonneborni]|uniref:VLIG-type G domain-containing protein n=1 Tax=Paramecium sonneborni TaxID=65129 RepID=A0A8S1QWM6_9CILI|nr:unnamed protein product [Paramecium sonneborni]
MPTLKTFIHTLYILFLLFKKCNEKQLDYLLTNLNLIIRNKSYDYALIRQEMSYKTPIQLILKMLLIQFMYLQNNAVTFDEYFIHNQSLKQDKLCENLYYLDSQLYERWLSPINYYNEFRLTPSYFSKQKQQQLILKETKISLYDFSISFSVMTNYEQVELIKSWVQSMNDQQKFKQLIPFFFNIIKRGENPKKFIQLINKELELNQSLFKNGLNMKALFQIFYNNSDYELQVMLLKFQCQNYPVPLIFQNQDLSNIKNKEENYLLNEKLYYIFPECFPIINISLSENQTTIGKTELINKIFYEMDEFETLDTCELNRNTIDIMFDFSFCGSRQFCIADTHGFIPISILSKLVPLFKLWIIQLDSEKELLDTLNKIYELFYPFQKQKIPEICLVIRNSIENTRENFINNWKEKTKVSLKLNSKQSEIFNNINNVHCIIDLKSKNISKESKETAIEEFQNFIFEVTLKILNKDKKQYINQNNYLEIIKGFNTSYKQVSEQIESDGIIMANLEDELKKQIITENGFYSITSFPLRSIHWQINNSKEELDQLFSLKDEKNNKKITQIKDKIKELEEQIKSQKPTKLLNLFCDLFEKKNNYILYLSFIDKIRLFNEQNTYVIQDQIQVLIESIQKLKKEISSLKQSNDQNPTDEGLKKLIKMKDEMKKQNDKLLLLKKNREFKNIGIELFWRELIQMKQKCTQQELRINPVDVVFDMIKKGEPFEFLDGDQLKIDQMFLQQLTDKFSQSGNEKVLVLSVLGPQSSGKSTILNKIFGCHFWTSVGRCTKGIYLQLIRISQKQYFNNLFDYILILDSEGLQNPNQQNDEFNKKIALFILSISDIILINVKGDIHSQFKNLVEMCIFTLGQMNNALATIKQISWCFNQNNDVNFFSCFLHQIQGIANNLNQEFNKTSQESQHQSNQENENQTIDYNEVLDIRKENIQILGFASYERGWKNKEYGFEKIWRQLIKNQTFSEEAYQYGVRIIKNYVQKKQQSSNMPSLHSFIQNINQNWQTICRSPELLEFTELIQYKQDELMKKQFTIIYDRYDFNFKNNIQDDIKRYIEIQRDINMETFKQLQKEKEQAIIEQFSQIEDEIIIELQQIKKEQQISKKILVKYENRLKQQISTEIEECKMIIFNEIKEQETKLQKNKGFLQIDNYISSISENTTELKKLQQNDKLIGQNFEEIWKEISTNQMKQMEEIFEEFSLKQYKLIFERFSVYKLKSDMEKDYQKFFIDKINKNSPFQNQQIEKEQIVEIFKNELKSYQFEIFQEELSGKNEWNKLYYELYDITLMNMRSNQNKSQIFNNNKNDSDDEISSIDINLIQMIMSKITLTVNSYKKQFAKFGIILNHIGERCIYYYSMFLIWRFSCYNKWKMLKKNYDTLQQHKSEQFTKYKEAIKSNKVEQSQIKAQLFARIIYQTFIQEYYQKKKKDVINFIETKNKTCFDIIKEQDKRLLEQYQSNFTQKQKDEVMLYITDQKNFIENYANQTISNIKEEITKDHQNKLKQELLNYLFVIHYNVNLISTQLQTEQKQGLKTIDYFETQDNQKLVDYEFEQEMFKIVKACIFKEKYQNPYGKSIKDDYQEYFNISKFKELSSKINVIMPSPSDNEIQQLKPYIQELLKQITKYLDQSENERLNINNFQIEGTIDKIKFHMIGCRQSCPLCKRKCDKPIDYNNYNHKHQCQNGHQLRGMNFVLIDNKPSLFTCEEITDDMLITTQQTNKVRFWKEIKQIYNDWNFKTLILQNDVNHQKQVKDKMMNVWNGGIGQLICNVLSNKFNKTIAFITKHDLAKYEQDKSKVHYIFMLDDSYSMQGQAWNNAKNGVLTCMEEIEKNPNAKVSVIIFNSKARVAIDCEKVNIDSQYDKIMKSDELFFFRHCNIEIAFQLVFDQIQKYKNQQFERNLILFYTDGGYSYPAQAMDKLIQLPLDQKKNISLIACSEKSNPATLSLMVSNLKENGYVADLRVNIKLGNFQKVWSEIVLQGIHVSD